MSSNYVTVKICCFFHDPTYNTRNIHWEPDTHHRYYVSGTPCKLTLFLIIIYETVKLFSIKKNKSFRKLRLGVNRYMGVYLSTSTSHQKALNICGCQYCYCDINILFIGGNNWNLAIIGSKAVKHSLGNHFQVCLSRVFSCHWSFCDIVIT